jgi:hypothetical protein
MPYRSEGHWVASPGGDASTGGAPGNANGWGARPGKPFWLSDDAETWGDITTHHGWWVHIDDAAPSGAWCWIPGAAATAARVVWRSADGFVGWAPEPPSVDEDDADVDDGSWSYTFLATLLDDAIDLLTDDAASVARTATERARFDRAHPGSPRRTGPDAAQVASARKALAAYAVAHPAVGSDGAASGRVAASPTVGTSTASASRNGGAAGSSSSPSEPTPSTHTTGAIVVKAEALPPAMALYVQMLHDPVTGPIGGPGFGPGWGPGASPFLPMVGLARSQGAHAGTYAAAPARSYGSSSSSSSQGSSHSSSSHSSSSSSSSSSSGSSSSSRSHK